jgi:hypothetical protein
LRGSCVRQVAALRDAAAAVRFAALNTPYVMYARPPGFSFDGRRISPYTITQRSRD